MKQYFVGEQGRPRTFWRICILIVLFFVITMPMMLGVRQILGGMPKGSLQQLAVVAAGATLAVFITRSFVDRRSIASLGLHFRWSMFKDIGFGILLSVLIIGGFFLITLMGGYITYEGIDWWGTDGFGDKAATVAVLTALGLVLADFALVAWWEELVFRGYIFQNLVDGLGKFFAIVFSCMIFGLAHAFNPNATLTSNLIIMLITLQLIYAYLASGALWLPMGMHLGWNFAQGGIFGFPVSGTESPSLILQSPAGPDWLSGGAFGPEDSLLIIPLLIASFPLIYVFTRGRTLPETD